MISSRCKPPSCLVFPDLQWGNDSMCNALEDDTHPPMPPNKYTAPFTAVQVHPVRGGGVQPPYGRHVVVSPFSCLSACMPSTLSSNILLLCSSWSSMGVEERLGRKRTPLAVEAVANRLFSRKCINTLPLSLAPLLLPPRPSFHQSLRVLKWRGMAQHGVTGALL